MFISSAYAQTAPAPAATTPPGDIASGLLSGPWPMLALMVVVMYFVIFRPQMKRQKEHKAMMDALAKGDEVVTSSGLMGKINGLAEGVVTLQIADGVEVQMQRSAVVQVLPKGTIK
jgi:preprotein translocase subunit YajC